MTPYHYAISTAVAVGKLDSARLEKEIRESSVISIALSGIMTSGDDCTVIFKSVLSTEEKTALDVLVGAHSGEPLPDASASVKLDAPTTADGKIIVQPSMFPGGVYLYITGAGDDGARGNGQPFAIQSDAVGDSAIEFSFKDWVYLSSGGFSWQGGAFGDYCTFEFYAPASPVTPSAGHTGNCNLVDPGVGAPILAVPAAGNGAYNIDLANAVPVPAFGVNDAPVGYWAWSEPSTGKGTVSAGAPGASPWHLFAAPIPLVRFANRLPLLGSGAMDMNPPPIKSKKMLPHWKGKVILHNTGHEGLKAAFWLATARAQTT
jgi:hypothetical protein